MSNNLIDKYPHIHFERNWKITDKSNHLLGECEAYIKSICNTPIMPKYLEKLLNVSLRKGAQATTAIEGNTLTDEEIEKIKAGGQIAPSKEYMKIEVENILEAFNELFKDVVKDGSTMLVTPDLIKRLNRMVGRGLGQHFDAIAGEFRRDNRTVGRYRCPDYMDVEELINSYCDWLRTCFRFEEGRQKFDDVIIQAIVSHIYLEWIHPFGDGNGRTGRLLEFYILLRGGSPNIASHILSNHYNLTRAEYYRQIENATTKRNLSEFIEYALQGFRDGLKETLDKIQENQFNLVWRAYIYEFFENLPSGKVMKRRRTLLLELPHYMGFSIKDIILATPIIAKEYAGLTERQVFREMEELIKLNLILRIDGKYQANVDILKSFFASKRDY
jgi:Fic family protein